MARDDDAGQAPRHSELNLSAFPAWVTLNRPKVHNACNTQMRRKHPTFAKQHPVRVDPDAGCHAPNFLLLSVA